MNIRINDPNNLKLGFFQRSEKIININQRLAEKLTAVSRGRDETNLRKLLTKDRYLFRMIHTQHGKPRFPPGLNCLLLILNIPGRQTGCQNRNRFPLEKITHFYNPLPDYLVPLPTDAAGL